MEPLRALTGRGILEILRASAVDFFDDHCPGMAAAIAYYAVFSLPPLIILVLAIVGAVWDPAEVRAAVEGPFGEMVGPDAAAQIWALLENAEQPGGRGALPTILGIAALVFGATGAFVQLQYALNRAWEVAPDPRAGGLRHFAAKRLFSFGMLLAVAFLLLLSLLVSAALSALGTSLAELLPGRLTGAAVWTINLTLSFLIVTLLFATIFRTLPDARIAWRDVWVGAAVTGLLFVGGKFALGFYLGRTGPDQAFGAASSLALLLLWIYYTSLIVLFGAEFTQRWSEGHGSGIEPEPGAVRVVEVHQTIAGKEA